MNVFRWLYPGLKVKRWFLLSLVGIVLAGTGLAMIIEGPFLGSVEQLLQRLLIVVSGPLPGTVQGMLVLALGVLIAMLGFRQMLHSIIQDLLPAPGSKLADFLFTRSYLRRGPRIVAIGGGTGQSVLLRGLKKYTANLTAVVTVTDDGGSSGRLRGELGVLPPGDVRSCLVALADTEKSMEDIFTYRFRQGRGLAGHSLGNLLITGLADMAGGFDVAIQELSRVLAIRGQVLPATLTPAVLVAEFADGSRREGETSISGAGKRITKVSLKPANCQPLPQVLQAIAEADGVVLGPGSLYTSILPILLMPQVTEALRKSRAPVFYVCNVMTEPGETDFYTASDHLKAIQDHIGPGVVDYMVVHAGPVPPGLREKYRRDRAYPVVVDAMTAIKLGVQVIRANLLDDADLVRHQPDRLARVILDHLYRHGSRWKRLRVVKFRLDERFCRLFGREGGR